MNTLGFREAFLAAQTVTLPGPLALRIPSMAAQALLKLVAWHDRRWDSKKDAIDLHTMLDWYDDDSQLDALYSENLDLLAAYDYDSTLANAHRLGRDIAPLLDPAAAQRVHRLLVDRSAMERLANDMGKSFDRSYQRLSAMYAGIGTKDTDAG